MKVLWVTSAYPSDLHPGSGVFHETQVQALIKQGIEVSIICPVPVPFSFFRFLKSDYRKRKQIPIKYERKGVHVYRPPYLAIPGQLRWAQPDKRIAKAILKTMDQERIQADVIHAHFAMPSGGATRHVAKVKKLPWILTLHGSDVNIYPHYSSGAMKVFRKTVAEANQVLSVGKMLSEKAKELIRLESKVLPIGVDLTKFQQPSNTKLELRRRLQLPEDKKLILFVGRLTKAKGIDELVDAVERISKDTTVVFVGDGPEKNRLKKLEAMNPRIILAGQVENDKVKDYMLASDVFALPSYSEGMPTVVIEALALKIPVICTDVGSVPDLFGKHEQLLIKKQSVDSLVERIEDILFRDLYTMKVQHELYHHVQKYYDANENARLLVDEYKGIVEFTEGREEQSL
ncbi:teichuronic acid biosynthesis protein TuaC [Bacillus sp. PS06]|uniref:teichuronic acid biosynthesis protein TuaC n=1 Tax=Bacillus sp. PS06 TaxID=2764176 RepID=UPI00177F1DBB|nr:glycosyltransferase family 4 protein [Bacillus sp. PS06]MBD8070888.1 glycosyltransferase family 4 protein [Bacillus sp. PS06]